MSNSRWSKMRGKTFDNWPLISWDTKELNAFAINGMSSSRVLHSFKQLKTHNMSLTLIEASDGYENVFFSTKDTIRRVYTFVDGSVLVFGISLNALLIHMIRTKTVDAMRIYAKLLTISCAIDLTLSVWSFLVQAIPVVDHGYRTIVLNGVFRNAAQPLVRYGVYSVWIHIMLLFLVTTTCQYVYRYCILCRDGRVPVGILRAMVFCCSLLFVLHVLVLTWSDYPRAEEAPKAVEIARLVSQETDLTQVSFIAFVKGVAPRWLLHSAIMCVIIPGFYAVIVLCSVKIRRAINAMNTFKLREYNNQVSAALLFQAILPSMEVIVWCVQILVPICVTDGKTVWYIVFTDIPVHLIPCVNPLGTILLVAPYRRAFLGYLGIQRASSVIIRTYTQVLSRSRNTATVRPPSNAAQSQ